jgi:hypothetical protein
MDGIVAGLNQVYYNEETDTATTRFLHACGLSISDARFVDTGMSIVNTVFSGYVVNSLRAAAARSTAQFAEEAAIGGGPRPGQISGNPANRLVETGTPRTDGTGWVRRWTKMTSEQEVAQAQAIANRYNEVLKEANRLGLTGEQQRQYILEQMQRFRAEYRDWFLQNR